MSIWGKNHFTTNPNPNINNYSKPQLEKTQLRELSFAVAFKFSDLSNIKNGNDFINETIKIIKDNENISNSGIKNYLEFAPDLQDIIKNSSNLANTIKESNYFKIEENDEIKWLGSERKIDPIDVKIGEYGFSLKEDSFILRNMGLSNFINVLTGKNYEKGVHVFETFAKSEYKKWFNYSFNKFVNALNEKDWILEKNNKISKAYIENNKITMDYNGEKSTISINSTIEDFKENTTSKTREKVFGKWINESLRTDKEYIKLKKETADKAGEQLSKLIKDNHKKSGIYEFFNFQKDPYYYAKNNGNLIEVYKVPSIEESKQSNFSLIDVTYNNPASQLNIITTFKNEDTGKIVKFRNECRFSHGQFNGVPEAKLYVDKETSLSDVYEPIIIKKPN